jgi:hypothetical protein
MALAFMLTHIQIPPEGVIKPLGHLTIAIFKRYKRGSESVPRIIMPLIVVYPDYEPFCHKTSRIMATK